MIEDSEIRNVSIWRNPRIYLTTLISLLIGGGGGYLVSNYNHNKEKVVLEEQISQSSNQNINLKNNYKNLAKEFLLAKAALVDLHEEKERLAEDYSVLKNTLEKNVQETDLTKNKLGDALKEKIRVEKEYAILENRFYKAETLITSLESTITRQDKSYNQLNESFDKIQRTVNEQSAHVKSLNKDLEDLTKEYSITEDKLATTEGRLADLFEEKRLVEESYALNSTRSQDEISRLEKYISDIIRRYGLGENPLDISTITIQKNSNWWDSTEAKIEERMGREINDQLHDDGRSRPWGIYIFNKAAEVRKDFPKQPEESQHRLENLDVVEKGDKFNVYLGDMNKVKE